MPKKESRSAPKPTGEEGRRNGNTSHMIGPFASSVNEHNISLTILFASKEATLPDFRVKEFMKNDYQSSCISAARNDSKSGTVYQSSPG
jgi:hypothetical protein